MLRIILKRFISTCTRIAREKFDVDPGRENMFDVIRQFYVLEMCIRDSRNIYVSGVTVRDVNTPIMVVGLPEAPITGIVMRDVYIQNAKQRCVFEDCKDLVLDDVYVDGKEIK